VKKGLGPWGGATLKNVRSELHVEKKSGENGSLCEKGDSQRGGRKKRQTRQTNCHRKIGTEELVGVCPCGGLNVETQPVTRVGRNTLCGEWKKKLQ